jgi:hypothetical protein
MSETEKKLFSILSELVSSNAIDPVVAEEVWEGVVNV